MRDPVVYWLGIGVLLSAPLLGFGCAVQGAQDPHSPPSIEPAVRAEPQEIDVGPEKILFATSPDGAPMKSFRAGDPIYARIPLHEPLAQSGEQAGEQSSRLSISLQVSSDPPLHGKATSWCTDGQIHWLKMRPDKSHTQNLVVAIVRTPDAQDDPVDFDASDCLNAVGSAIESHSKTLRFKVALQESPPPGVGGPGRALGMATFSIALERDSESRLLDLYGRYEEHFASRRLPDEPDEPGNRLANADTLDGVRRYIEAYHVTDLTALRAVLIPRAGQSKAQVFRLEGLTRFFEMQWNHKFAIVAFKQLDGSCVSGPVGIAPERFKDKVVVTSLPGATEMRRIACERVAEAEAKVEADRVRVFQNRRLPASEMPDLEANAIRSIHELSLQKGPEPRGNNPWDKLTSLKILAVSLAKPQSRMLAQFLESSSTSTSGYKLRPEWGRDIPGTGAFQKADGTCRLIEFNFWQANADDDSHYQTTLRASMNTDPDSEPLPCENVTAR